MLFLSADECSSRKEFISYQLLIFCVTLINESKVQLRKDYAQWTPLTFTLSNSNYCSNRWKTGICEKLPDITRYRDGADVTRIICSSL